MKHDGIIYARVPSELQDALERERLRRNKKPGTKMNTSAVIRAILGEALLTKKERAA